MASKQLTPSNAKRVIVPYLPRKMFVKKEPRALSDHLSYVDLIE
ncbi:hypothetical protein M7I_0957 [Glarea lozoyensis 74030]|uniref:Uncharacterized protein n=1 Tax=Glarea lozoyensis (strain ATCC 74030 / MF5533) TaxID=1104152 RepID=H0EES3_GLAL7|nr:hypothetical protein M7I_0957 [Glarea lozoyensis 74030]